MSINQCNWCGKKYFRKHETCADKDHEEWLQTDDFEMMVHKEIYETGESNWYDQEGVERYQEHFKNNKDCKFCKALKY